MYVHTYVHRMLTEKCYLQNYLRYLLKAIIHIDQTLTSLHYYIITLLHHIITLSYYHTVMICEDKVPLLVLVTNTSINSLLLHPGDTGLISGPAGERHLCLCHFGKDKHSNIFSPQFIVHFSLHPLVELSISPGQFHWLDECSCLSSFVVKSHQMLSSTSGSPMRQVVL